MVEEGTVLMSSSGKDYHHERRVREKRNSQGGVFVAIDGLDGIGKGEIERALRGYEERQGKAVFDSISFSMAHEQLPELSDFFRVPRPHFNVIITAEPTYVGTGKDIREEITVRNGREYSARAQIEMYSNDRLIQMKRVVVPALENGLNVIQSRCFASTLTYQLLKAGDESLDSEKIKREIMSHEGNIYQMNHRPDLLIIPTIEDVEQLKSRLKERGRNEKEDNSMFENADFQGRLKPLYESDWLRETFESVGTRVAYLNAGLGIEDSRRQAVDIYKGFVEDGKVSEKYSLPSFK